MLLSAGNMWTFVLGPPWTRETHFTRPLALCLQRPQNPSAVLKVVGNGNVRRGLVQAPGSDFYMNIRRSAFQLRFPKGLDVCHGSAGASRWPRPVITDQERPQMSCMDTDHSEGRTPALFVVHVFVDSKPFVTSRLQFKTSQEEVIKHKRPKQARNKARCSANKESQKHT